ncbi:MAG: hypothetical protein ACOH1M_07195 [Rhodoglobus sp.]
MKKLGFVASIAGGVIALASLSGVGVYAANGGFEPEPAPTPTAVVVTVEENTLRQETPETTTPTVVIPPVVVVEAPAPVVEPAPAPAPPPAPTKCPANHTPGQVDGAGNESLCAPNSPEGKQCAEYTDNVCTGWLQD